MPDRPETRARATGVFAVVAAAAGCWVTLAGVGVGVAIGQTVTREPTTKSAVRSMLRPVTPQARTLTLTQLRAITSVGEGCGRLAGRGDCTMAELVDACQNRGLGYLECTAWATNLTGRPRGWATGNVRAHKPTAKPDATTGRPSGASGQAGAAPSTPATTPGAPAAGPAAQEGEDGSVGGSGHDLLADNGLRSPWCEPGHDLNAQGRVNCAQSGLASSGAAGDNAGFDKHVDTGSWTGAPKIDRWFISMILLLLSLVWSLLVTATRGIFTALEIAFSFNLLDPTNSGSWTGQLERQVRAITAPVAVLLAPVGGVWIAWTAGARQRPGHALRHSLLSGLILTASLLVLANPLSTVGWLMSVSQRVGVGVIGLTAGQPGNADQSAQGALQAMADQVIDQPLALLEFGDAAWGTNPEDLDPALRAAALKLAAKDTDTPNHTAAVRAAKSNLDLFEVWPANSPQRNAINQDGSLLRVMCGSDKDTECKGPNKQRAQFRTQQGVWQRAIALVVIALGLVPFWIAVGFCAVKIITASVMSLVRLFQLTFLAPVVLIGEQGNQRLISFAGQWAGTILSAATYSFFLGLIMLTWRLLTALPGYGFITQWLLLMVALWQLIAHRHQLWGSTRNTDNLTRGAGGQMARYAAISLGSRTLTHTPRRLRATTGRIASGTGRRIRELPRPGAGRRSDQPAGTAMSPNPGAEAGAASGSWTAGGGPAGGVPGREEVWTARRGRAIQNDRAVTHASSQRQHVLAARNPAALNTRRQRLSTELATVNGQLSTATGRQRAGLLRRRASLTGRQQTVSGQLDLVRRAEQTAQAAQANPRKDRAIRSGWLDRQAALPRGSTGSGPTRVYPHLACLTGQTPAQYRASPPARQLATRARVDRELERRTQHRYTLQQANQPTQPNTSTAAAGGPAIAPTDRAGSTPVGARPAPAPDRAARREQFRRHAHHRPGPTP